MWARSFSDGNGDFSLENIPARYFSSSAFLASTLNPFPRACSIIPSLRRAGGGFVHLRVSNTP
jgi:hypothetical protein